MSLFLGSLRRWRANTPFCFGTLPSQAPWQNGVYKTGGGILKAIGTAIIKSQSLLGAEEADQAVQEAVTAYNSDINEAGVTPAQAALGPATPNGRRRAG